MLRLLLLLFPFLLVCVTVGAQERSWQPGQGLVQVSVWPGGAPDMEGFSQPPERVEMTKPPDVVAGRPYAAVYDVSIPTMTVFPPKGKNTGVSMVVFPGGGFQLLAIDLEGTEL